MSLNLSPTLQSLILHNYALFDNWAFRVREKTVTHNFFRNTDEWTKIRKNKSNDSDSQNEHTSTHSSYVYQNSSFKLLKIIWHTHQKIFRNFASTKLRSNVITGWPNLTQMQTTERWIKSQRIGHWTWVSILRYNHSFSSLILHMYGILAQFLRKLSQWCQFTRTKTEK